MSRESLIRRKTNLGLRMELGGRAVAWLAQDAASKLLQMQAPAKSKEQNLSEMFEGTQTGGIDWSHHSGLRFG